MKKSGHSVFVNYPSHYNADTLLVIWNRYADNHEVAKRVEAGGGKVIVAENGYLGHGGTSPKFDVHPHGPKPGDYYALSVGYHNGGGYEPRAIDGERFNKLGVELKPWRASGDHILVCPNRSFGPPERAMHTMWGERTVNKLRRVTKRPVVLRVHPGNDAPKRAIGEDLKGAWAVCVWSSTCGIHALVAGIPVFSDFDCWIMKAACATGSIDNPVLSQDIRPAFNQLAWAQWTCEEIASGEPFRYLLPGSG